MLGFFRSGHIWFPVHVKEVSDGMWACSVCKLRINRAGLLLRSEKWRNSTLLWFSVFFFLKFCVYMFCHQWIHYHIIFISKQHNI